MVSTNKVSTPPTIIPIIDPWGKGLFGSLPKVSPPGRWELVVVVDVTVFVSVSVIVCAACGFVDGVLVEALVEEVLDGGGGTKEKY